MAETCNLKTNIINIDPIYFLKGIVQPKMLFTTCMSIFHLLNTEEDILKNVQLFCVQQRRETKTGLQQLEGE